MAQRTPKKPAKASEAPASATPSAVSQPPSQSQAEPLGEWLKAAGERVDLLTRELAERDERIGHLEWMLADAESRRHEADLAHATAVADLVSAGERILELEAQLAEARSGAAK